MLFKKHILIIGIALTSIHICRSQCLSINIIKNPNLEDYTCCPNNMALIDCATFWTQPLPQSTSEYFNTCGIDSLLFPNLLTFFQHAYFGNGYAGICTFTYNPLADPPWDYREYVQGTLSVPLQPNQCYYCEFWVKCWNWENLVPYCANDALGIYFSDTLPKKTSSDPMAMIFPSQINNATGRIISDTANWTKVSGSFIASGGEKFFTVGNFLPPNEVICTYFGVPQTKKSYYFFDNFSLCPCDDTIPPKEPESVVYIPNIFTPNNDSHNDVFYVRGQQIESLHLMVYNRWGNMVFESNDIKQGWDGTHNGRECAEGVFFYVAEIGFANGVRVFKKGTVTLVN